MREWTFPCSCIINPHKQLFVCFIMTALSQQKIYRIEWKTNFYRGLRVPLIQNCRLKENKKKTLKAIGNDFYKPFVNFLSMVQEP